MTVVLLPADALLDELGEVPGGTLVTMAAGEPPTGAALDAEAVVFGMGLAHLLGSLRDLPHLRLVQSLNAGVEWLLPHIPDGVTLCNASGVHDAPVAEWVVGAVIATYRELPRYVVAQQRGEWDLTGNAVVSPPEDITGDDLQGKTVLVVGHGSIGQAVASRLAPFGATVVGVARHPRPGVRSVDELPELVPAADVVVLLAPLTDETRGMVDAAFLARMRDGAVLVNAARGALVDQAALEAELRAGRLRAALDVTDPEPLPEGHSLWSAPGCLITPHTAGSTRRWLARAYRFAGDQLRRFTAGEPLANVREAY